MLRALKILAPHFREIGEMWYRLMRHQKLDLETGDMEELACLTLVTHQETLAAGKAAVYRQALMQCGQSLDRRGVPLSHATIATSLYLEICCAFLLNLHIREPSLTMALVHFNSASQLLVVAGYSRQHSTNLLKVVEKERRRFSRDLHDEIGHNLIVLKLYLELMARDYKRGRKEDVIEKLEEAMTLVSQSINSVRRVILDIGPAVLDQLGLVPSFKVYAGQFSTRTGIKVEVRGKDTLQMPKIFETALFRVFQGALSNVAKHSKAKKVQVTVRSVRQSVIQLSIEDDGVGFVTTKQRAKESFGLIAMRERVERFGGQFSVKSRPVSSKILHSGTRIDVDLPITGETAEEVA
jgi:signal transduction histidine kinase